MATSAKRVRSVRNQENGQLDLMYSEDSLSKYWNSKDNGLFNSVYLRIDISDKHPYWKDEEDVDFQYFLNGLRNLAVEFKDKEHEQSNWSETETINSWVKHVLNALGWTNNCKGVQDPFLEETSFRYDSKTYRTDILVVDTPKEKQYVKEADAGDDRLREARQSVLMPIEVKYWQRLEEFRIGKKEEKRRADNDDDDIARTFSPGEQIIQYMNVLKKNWGILTDGAKWRLFNSDVSSEDPENLYYEFNLNALMQAMSTETTQSDSLEITEAAKYFYHFFSKFAFFPKNEGERPFVDEVLQYSKKYVSHVEQDLRFRFVNAMNVACNGFIKATGKPAAKLNLDSIRNISESTLFNVLFIRSLESRGVLPMASTDYKKISITSMMDKIEKFDPDHDDADNIKALERVFSKGNGNSFAYTSMGTELHDRILRLTGVIHKGASKKDNFGFEIEGFRESIFSKDEWDFFKSSKISNHHWVQILFELGYSKTDSRLNRSRKYQQIPYANITARQLGSIYESFLEYTLLEAKTDMIFESDTWKAANLDSPKVRLLRLPKIQKNEYYFSKESDDRKSSGSFYTPHFVVEDVIRRTLAPVIDGLSSKELLEIKVCDPAMGSGHFLASALQYLSKQLLLRKDAEVMGTEHNFRQYKQDILHNCINGVDINSRAVKLAKMSLWLQTATFGNSLQNLDGQLKVGDSLSLSKPFSWSKSFNFDESKGYFSAIIGNPPWGADIDHLRDQIDKRFGQVAKNHKEIYKLFVQIGFEVLKKNGRLGFVLPSGILYQPRSADVREYSTSIGELQSVVNLGEGIFGKDVVAPSCAIIWIKGATKNAEFSFKDLTKVQKIEDKELAIKINDDIVVSMEEVLNNPLKEFTMGGGQKFTGENFLAFEEILELKDSGINYQRVGVGMKVKGKSDLADRLLYEGKPESSKDIMYWKGEDINEFFIAKKTARFVRHNFKDIPKKGEVVRVAVELFKSSPKLLWRQTASQPICVLDETGVAFGRSIQCGVLQDGYTKDWYCYMAILFNSEFVRDQYKMLVMEEGRVFPQIKLAKLKRLAIPKATASELAEAKTLYYKCLNDPGPANKQKANQFVAKVVARCEEKDKKKSA